MSIQEDNKGVGYTKRRTYDIKVLFFYHSFFYFS